MKRLIKKYKYTLEKIQIIMLSPGTELKVANISSPEKIAFNEKVSISFTACKEKTLKKLPLMSENRHSDVVKMVLNLKL